MNNIRSAEMELRSGSSEPYSILSCFKRSNVMWIRHLIFRKYSTSFLDAPLNW